MLHQQIDTEATRAGLAGLEGTNEIRGYDGMPILASWGPLGIPGTKWALITKIDSAETLAPIRTLQRELTVVGALAPRRHRGQGKGPGRSLAAQARRL